MLRIENLVKHFDAVKAVDGISFRVTKGEIVGFLGPNGAGKTTTMKIITGYLAPSSGTVHIQDMDISDHPLETKRLIGYVPESFPIYDDMLVYDYLRYTTEIRGIERGRAEERIRAVGELCGLQAVIGRPVGELSKGFRQRVGLAQALIHEPEILILDEPTDGLDPNQKVEIRKLIKEIGKTRTILLSTHNLSEVQLVCDRVMIIHNGKIVADGRPEELQEGGGGNNVLHIAFDKLYSDVADRLKFVPGVLSVREAPQHEHAGAQDLPAFRVEYGKDTEIRPHVFNLAKEHGWVVMEMYREQASLEDVFQRLTRA